MEINSEELLAQIEKAKEGHQSAFNFLLDRFWNEIYGFQLQRTKNEHDAEDISIQTFSKAFDKIHTFNSSYSFSTWLTTISKNIHIDLIRKNNASIRAKTSDEKIHVVNEIADNSLSIEDTLIKEQNLAQLLADIKQLKPHYQEMINLRYFQELSYQEIATHVHEPVNNVKVKLLRAKKLLASIIKHRDI
ncbi:MAG TPA: sigma-70 family RNA polymerase sigma factor [Salinimicrobium sp.]|nr:sigma-70 family RNA polymerase sigma factor [Salinimicrobium sp.]